MFLHAKMGTMLLRIVKHVALNYNNGARQGHELTSMEHEERVPLFQARYDRGYLGTRNTSDSTLGHEPSPPRHTHGSAHRSSGRKLQPDTIFELSGPSKMSEEMSQWLGLDKGKGKHHEQVVF